MPKAYRVLRVSTKCGACDNLRPGEVVYKQRGYDYGLSSDDTRATGVEHITVTRDPEGDYPGFTIAKRDLWEL